MEDKKLDLNDFENFFNFVISEMHKHDNNVILINNYYFFQNQSLDEPDNDDNKPFTLPLVGKNKSKNPFRKIAQSLPKIPTKPSTNSKPAIPPKPSTNSKRAIPPKPPINSNPVTKPPPKSKKDGSSNVYSSNINY